jgi:hypothetical protein
VPGEIHLPRREIDPPCRVEQRDRPLGALERVERVVRAATVLRSAVEPGHVGAQEVENGALALVEVHWPAAVEEKDLGVPERRIQSDGHLVLDAPRAEPLGVDLAATELAPGDEIGELQRPLVTGRGRQKFEGFRYFGSGRSSVASTS